MSFLTRTYPFKQSKHLLKDSSIFGFIIWVILYFLQPFGLCLYQGNKCFVATLFGLVTFGCHITYAATILKYLHQTIKPWRIWHEGVAILGLIFIIAFGNFLLFSYLFHYTIKLDYYHRHISYDIIYRNAIQQNITRENGRVVAQYNKGTGRSIYYHP